MMISVIVPVYQVERYLARCVESLIHQSCRELEVLLVDDGSPDRCGEICDQNAVLDSRIVVVHQKNAGASAARNAGLKIGRGEYIGFCDPDDWTAPEMYDELLRAMEDKRAELAVCGYNYYDEDDRVDAARRYEERETELLDRKTTVDRLADMPPSIRHVVWNKLFRRSLLRDIWFDERRKASEDLAFLEEYLPRVNTTAVVHKPLYQNLVRSSSATHGGLSTQSLWLSFSVHEKMYHMAAEQYPELKNRAMAYLLDVLTLKYNMARRRTMAEPERAQRRVQKGYLSKMRRTIRRYALRGGLTNPEIYWKTRIAYIIQR